MNYRIIDRDELEEIVIQQECDGIDQDVLYEIVREGRDIKGVIYYTDEELIEWVLDYGDMEEMIEQDIVKPFKITIDLKLSEEKHLEVCVIIVEDGVSMQSSGYLIRYHAGRDDVYNFEPDWHMDDKSREYYSEHSESIEKLIIERFENEEA
jgi:hypothetical protein